MKKGWLFVVMACCASTVIAVLPERVEEACFTAEVTEFHSGRSWRLTSWEKWKGVSGMQVTMDEKMLCATLAGAAHPDQWYTTSLMLQSPVLTDFVYQPLQTLTITVKSEGLVEKDKLLVRPIVESPLPPFTIETKAGRLALIAKDKQWYIVIDDPKARVLRDSADESIVTVECEVRVLASRQSLQTKLYVGEGELQEAMIPALP